MNVLSAHGVDVVTAADDDPSDVASRCSCIQLLPSETVVQLKLQ
jgi:hypothetical protein